MLEVETFSSMRLEEVFHRSCIMIAIQLPTLSFYLEPRRQCISGSNVARYVSIAGQHFCGLSSLHRAQRNRDLFDSLEFWRLLWEW